MSRCDVSGSMNHALEDIYRRWDSMIDKEQLPDYREMMKMLIDGGEHFEL